MKFVKPSVEKWEQQIPPLTRNKKVFREAYLKAMCEHIERCGRVCYKSEDKVGEKDPKIFVDRLISSCHYSVLEHGTIYLKIKDYFENYLIINYFLDDPYTVSKNELDTENKRYYYHITTNYRVIVENNLFDALKFLSVPTEHHELRYTFCCTTDIGVSREFNRSRKNSISEESTRFCNYSKDKFNNSLTFVIPAYYTEQEISDSMTRLWGKNLPDPGAEPIDWYVWSLRNAEISYLQQVNSGVLPQQARQVLPLSTKTTLVHTAFENDWQHFIDLRSKGITGAPHPNIKVIADMIKDKLNIQN